ncbi:MAG: PIG-L family deacetylase, partial [Acidobacteria bacterium]|nr:PIG-L family deacetylase [Acidobacteriota bacterium]
MSLHQNMPHLELWRKTEIPFSAIAARSLFLFLSLTALLAAQSVSTPPTSKTLPAYLEPLPQDTGSSGLKQALRRLANCGRLLMVTAHPDDEDGGLLTLEARGKGVETMLLTLTRGEGGQNKTGDTFSDELGVLRTLELLAADRYYGVEQRFTRVADFGYSKTADETFEKWGGHDVPLRDIVRVIRQFRPDVVIARFSGTEADGHGHHQASAMLTKEAFRAAADPHRFAEQIKAGLQPWQPKKLYIGNVCGFGAAVCPDQNWTVKLNTAEDDPVLGVSYVQFAIEGLRHQQSQGLADLRIPAGPRSAFYRLADSALPKTTDANGHEKDLFDGIDTSLPGLAATFGHETSLPWLKPELEKVARELHESITDLLSTVRDLQSIADRVQHSSLPAEEKAPLLEGLEQKTLEAQTALDLALNATLEVIAAPSEGPGGASEPEALSSVSPGQRFQVIAKLRNGSKYWLKIGHASLNHADWVRRT